MQPAHPQQGLMPSVLDRLIDPESKGTAIVIGYDADKMYRAVLRDLEDLLNTRRASPDLPEHLEQARDSILAYGLPDLVTLEDASSQRRSEIGRAIEEVIARFEPRLRDVQATLLNPAEDLAKLSVRVRVEARLCVDPAPEVAFDTVLEMASGTYRVAPAEHE